MDHKTPARELVSTPVYDCPFCSIIASEGALIDKFLQTWTEEFTLALISAPETQSIVDEARTQGHSVCTAALRLQVVIEEREPAA